MPVIRISDTTLADLRSIATWLGMSTPGETVEHLARQGIEQLGMEQEKETLLPEDTEGGVVYFDSAPELTHTKILAASINGIPLEKPTWASLLINVIRQMKEKGLSGERLVRELSVPAELCELYGQGYRYHKDLGISVQGQSASDCWSEVNRLSSKWKIPVSVKFQWRQNQKARHPGRVGSMQTGLS